MPALTLAEIRAIAGAERERLVEADDAVRDCTATVEAAAERDGLDAGLVSRGLVGVLLSVGARQAISAYPSTSKRELRDAFVGLAAEAFDWTAERATKPKKGGKG
jgi:hypothetical protein